jgi:hypothetical protein
MRGDGRRRLLDVSAVRWATFSHHLKHDVISPLTAPAAINPSSPRGTDPRSCLNQPPARGAEDNSDNINDAAVERVDGAQAGTAAQGSRGADGFTNYLR